ncbi:hypothetical protein Hanom_Chr03g00254001 [Helianthus anomalus]
MKLKQGRWRRKKRYLSIADIRIEAKSSRPTRIPAVMIVVWWFFHNSTANHQWRSSGHRLEEIMTIAGETWKMVMGIERRIRSIEIPDT